MTHRHSYYHPVEHRYLTQREAAAIQSFPNNFVFHGPLSAQWRQIGNAVPPRLAFAIGNALLKMFALAQNAKEKKSRKKVSAQSLKMIRGKAFHYKNSKLSKKQRVAAAKGTEIIVF